MTARAMPEAVVPKARLMEITPSLADDWLKKVPDFQRKIDEKQVKKLIIAIQRNEWRNNGATIVFNEAGELIDGQHRLLAIKESGRTVLSLVVRDVSSGEDTFHTIGDEKPRKLTDFMRCPYTAVTAAVVKTYWSLMHGKWPVGHGGATAPIADLMKLAKKFEDSIGPLIPPIESAGRLTGQYSFCVFLAFYYTKIHPVNNVNRLAQFFARVGDGVSLEADDPCYRLRQRFLSLPATGKIQRTSAHALILKALHLYLSNQPCEKPLRFEPNREEFPLLRGMDRKGR